MSYQSVGVFNKITGNLDSWANVDAVFLDFAKAFYKVPHDRLSLKLLSHIHWQN